MANGLAIDTPPWFYPFSNPIALTLKPNGISNLRNIPSRERLRFPGISQFPIGP
jgi:hypothetical protein